jgi:hypothetical protein
MATDCNVCKSTFGRVNIKKRLIVCCDGTFSGVDKGTDDYSSNVGRLSRAISRVGVTESGEKIPQIVYYQSGVGTGSLTYIDKQRQGTFLCAIQVPSSSLTFTQVLLVAASPRTSARPTISSRPTGARETRSSFLASRGARTRRGLWLASSAKSVS